MKQLKKMPLALVLGLLLQTFPLAQAKQENRNQMQTIEKAIRSYNQVFDSTGESHQALEVMIEQLSANGDISANDLKNYMGFRMGLHSPVYQNFEELIEVAEREFGQAGTELSAEELGMLTAQMMNDLGAQGQQWSGCAGLTVGIVLAIAAVVVGVIALVKTEGEHKKERRYQRRIRDRERSYDRDVSYVINRPDQIEFEKGQINRNITSYNNSIDEMQIELAYWNGVLNGAIGQPGEEIDAAKAQEANAKIKEINDQIARTRGQIDDLIEQIRLLDIEKNRYLDPVFVNNRLTELQIDFERDVRHLEARMEQAIANVPMDKENAKTLGIIAGAAAGVGTYFIIDGSRSCN